MTNTSPIRVSRRTAVHVLRGLLLLLSAIFLALHALHLNADFPNHSPWMDWSKYTDEGWYGDAAIRHFQRGHWNVPGDFNPAAALPVWPLLESIVFHFTGVSALAARALAVAIFALILLAAYALLTRWQRLSGASRHTLAPALAVLLLAVSPFCYAFTRMAILEPLLILLTLLALLTASYLHPAEQGAEPRRQRLRHMPYPLLPALLGLLLTLMVLTKTTAIFLLPAVVWLLWARAGYRLRPFLRLAVPTVSIAILSWIAYFLLIVRPHFLSDYRYLFSANAYTGFTPATALAIFSDTVADGLWIGHLLYSLALLAVALVLIDLRRYRTNPLIAALLFWAAGYTAFLAYHDNLQPRYYLVVAIPLTLLIPLVFESFWTPTRSAASPTQPRLPPPLAAAALLAALLATVLLGARQTLLYVRYPEYTFANAASQIRAVIDADRRQNPAHSPLVLSISGSNLSLMTGLPSICDDFGTMELTDRIQAYHPGWYVAWNQVDDDKMDALAPLYHLQRVAAFPAMDDPERNLLILYRLDPPTTPVPRRPHHHRPIPQLLQTSLGQQPSQTQLEH